jgi:BirA family biotin operon repressor/biotin-[acetyl-CoA-carboxylase] ligase
MDFDGRHLTERLEGRLFGKRVHFLREVDSTNLCAAEMAQGGAEEGEVVVSEHQRKGRGRLGRSWQSPPGVNLYASFVLRPRIPAAVAPQITLTAGVAVAEALSTYCAQGVTLKWPNDVQIGGRKVCGILAEMRLKGREVDFVIVGIGINVNIRREDFDPAFRDTSTSLREELGREISRLDVAVRMFNCFETWYGTFIKDGFQTVRGRWLTCAGILRKEIEVRSGDELQTGRVLGIDDEGALLLEAQGKVRRVIAGDVILSGEHHAARD